MIGRVTSNLLGLVGATIGAILGYSIFNWLVSQNLYGLMIPGAVMGLGCCKFAHHRSLPRGIACGLAAIVLGLYTEWRFSPFRADDGFKYLVVHFFDLKQITQLMIAVGALIAFWLGKDASPFFSVDWLARIDQPAASNSSRSATSD